MTQSICTTNQARQADTLAIQQYRIPSLLLMEHAAQECFSLLKKRLQNARSSVIVCGPGNNGADGLAIARLCKDHKIQCTVFLPDPCHLSMDERIQWDMIQALDIPHISDLETNLKKIEQVSLNSTEKSIPHIVNISIIGIKPETLLHALEAHEIYVSTKSACATEVKSDAVLAVTNDEERAMSSIRISLSYMTTEEEVHTLIRVLKEEIERLKW